MREATSEITTSSPCSEETAASDFRGGRPTNPTFALRGVNHLALVCRNMARTVEFYRDILGMPLVKTVELPFGQGQHFFFVTAIGSMNHVAFDVAPEHFDQCRQRLVERGIRLSPVMNHDDSELTVALELHPGVYVRSMYFRDPDGILLESAAWTRQLGEADVLADPAITSGA